MNGVRYVLLFLFYPLFWINMRAEIRDRELFRWMMHPAMLASEQLLLVAQKA
jgi:hypothetical protein